MYVTKIFFKCSRRKEIFKKIIKENIVTTILKKRKTKFDNEFEEEDVIFC